MPSILDRLRQIAGEEAPAPVKLSLIEAREIRAKHPGIPDSYIDLLTEVGWGDYGGIFLDEKPRNSLETLGPDASAGLGKYLFVGHDAGGWSIAFDTSVSPWQVVPVNFDMPEPMSDAP